MKRFAQLYAALDASTANSEKIAALHGYFAHSSAQDSAFALGILLGQKNTFAVSGADLRAAASAASGLPLWLVEDCYAQVGDLAETCALLAEQPHKELAPLQQEPALPQLENAQHTLAFWCTQELPKLIGKRSEEKIAQLVQWWRTLNFAQRLVLNKMLTGGLRVGVAQGMVLRALEALSHCAVDVLAHRLMGGFHPSAEAWQSLIASDQSDTLGARPYPFFLASPLFETSALAGIGQPEIEQALGDLNDWYTEWKWDGIRAQLIVRSNLTQDVQSTMQDVQSTMQDVPSTIVEEAAQVAQSTVAQALSPVFWSRGEERLDGRFPELERAAQALPANTVLDGEVLCWQSNRDMPDSFLTLQKRINTRTPSAKLQASHPVRFIAYDCLEFGGRDLRTHPHSERRRVLSALLPELAQSNDQQAAAPMVLSPLLAANTYPELQGFRASARERGVEGLMLKRKSAAYAQGRKRGDWWKWKLNPMSVDAVLTYAQAGHGRRANLYTDYTFALWHQGQLMTVAKAYSGLNDVEIAALDKWIRAHTLERFGPVRAVQPQLVFELGFEAVHSSARHKSGVAVRFPRILRWRTDKLPSDADQLDALRALAP